MVCTALFPPGDAYLWALEQNQPMADGSGQEAEGNMVPEQLNSLVIPAALYRDPARRSLCPH